MIIDKFTKHSIFSLPLIFYNLLNQQDLKENEFVNMYTCDINNPIYSNHIFLVFHNIKDSLLNILRRYDKYEADYNIVLNNIHYKVVCFTRDFPIQNILSFVEKGKYIDFSFKNKMLILQFWNAKARKNPKLFEYLFNDELKPERPVNEIITREDTNKKASS